MKQIFTSFERLMRVIVTPTGWERWKYKAPESDGSFFVDGNFNADKYIDMLQEKIFQSLFSTR